MKINKITLFLFSIILLSGRQSMAQQGDFNQWIDHLPYTKCKAVVEVGDMIYGAASLSVFSYNKKDNSLSRINKVTGGLSDMEISSIAYSSQYSALVVAYTNTNIDLVKGTDVINIPDIKRKQILGNKTINSILIKDKYAYLSCGFGIVVVDIEKEEIKDTYYIGPSGSQIDVKMLAYHQEENKFYAATESGIYGASVNSNLAYYVNWVKESTLPDVSNSYNLVASFAGKLYANKSIPGVWSNTMYVKNGANWSVLTLGDDSPRSSLRICGDRLVLCNYASVTVFQSDNKVEKTFTSYQPGEMTPNDALIDKEGKLWVADNLVGMWSIGSDMKGLNYTFNGPSSSKVAAIDISNRQLWAVPGGRTAGFGYLYQFPQFYTLADGTWNNYTGKNIPEINTFRDILCVAADPGDGSHAFLGSWGYGVIEMTKGKLTKIYDTTNSTLRYVSGYEKYVGNLRVGGLAFDKNKNLWVTNSGAYKVLSMRKPSGEWRSFDLGEVGHSIDVGTIVIDKSNQKWMQLRDLSLFVFNDNNTPDNPADDDKKKLTAEKGNGGLQGSTIASMAVDRDGQLWLGTDAGVMVIDAPENVFRGGNYDAQKVKIEKDGKLYDLLETETVTAIAVNGNNEKWFGTEKSGVFLMSEDGGKELLHFDESNSRLLSNSIQSIKVASNGEVYFGTSNGIISYLDYKVEPKPTLDSLFVFPNPVRPEYQGPVFISNLAAESNIKITDISGALVYEIQGQGGRVVWNGNNLEGRRVNSGVYLIFVTNPDGTQKRTAKVLFMR